MRVRVRVCRQRC